jgi:hypothetical protein
MGPPGAFRWRSGKALEPKRPIEYLQDKIVAGRDPDEIYRTVEIIVR